MGLYTDSSVLRIEDLQAHETGILDTASVEGINLTTKIGLAREEVGLEIQSALRRLSASDALGISLETIVVTPALRLWQTFHTLATVYRDAYHNQLNDRYKGKWFEYRDLARWASGLLFQIGLGVVTDPVREADTPLISAVGGGLEAGRYFVRASWLSPGGEEGAAGPMVSIDLEGVSGFQVSTGLAVTWNVYAGVTPHDLFLQNPTPLGPGTTWIADGGLVSSGARPGSGQEADFFRSVPRAFLRG